MNQNRGADFTPGPWEVFDRRPNIDDFEVSCGDSDRNGGLIVASCVGPDKEANSRLIAAAPKLYAKVAIAATIFREYERLHLAKRTPDGDTKAKRNAEYAEEMEAALAEARGAQQDQPHD